MYDRLLTNYVRTRLLPSNASKEAVSSTMDRGTQDAIPTIAAQARPAGNVFASVSGAVTQFASGASSRLAARSNCRVIGREMAALDDRVLADIGLNRGQLPAALVGMGQTPWSRDWAADGPQDAADTIANNNSRTKTAA